MLGHLKFILSKKSFISVMLLLAIGGVIAFTAFKPVQHKAYLFFTVERKDFSQTNDYKYNQYYGAQAADSFTSVVQGWFEDPKLIKSILGRIDFNYLGVRKEERQNIIISFKNNDQSYLVATLDKLTEVLQQRINQYNQETGTNFVFSLMSAEVKEGSQVFNWFLNVVIAFIIGLFVAIAAIYMKAYSQGLFIFKEQLELEQLEYLGFNGLYEYQKEYLLTDFADFRTVFVVALDVPDVKLNFAEVINGCLESEMNNLVLNLVNLNYQDNDLHNCLGISEKIKNINGIADVINKEDLIKYKTKLNENIKYLAFGSKNKFKKEVISWLAESEENNVFYCGNSVNNLNLFNDFVSKEPVRSDWKIILLVKLWKTKLEAIKKIQNNYGIENIIIYVI